MNQDALANSVLVVLEEDLADAPRSLMSEYLSGKRIPAAQPSPKLAAGREPAVPSTGQITWPECLCVHGKRGGQEPRVLVRCFDPTTGATLHR